MCIIGRERERERERERNSVGLDVSVARLLSMWWYPHKVIH